MQTKTIHTKINENLILSTLIDDKLFFITNNTLYMQNIFQSTKITIRPSTQATHIFQHVHDIAAIHGNKLTIYTQKGIILKEIMLEDVCICKDNRFLFAPLCNKIYLLENYDIKKIRVVQKTREKIVDVSFNNTNNNAVVLTESSKIYFCSDVSKSERILLNIEIIRVNFDPKQIIRGIEYKNNRLLLKYDDSVEICRISENLVLVICTIKSKGLFEVKSYEGEVYYICEKLYVLKDVPLVVCADKIRYLINNVAVYEDKLLICQNEEKSLKEYEHVESTLGAEKRIKSLFEFVTNDACDVYKEKVVSTEEDLLIFKKEVEEFKQKYIDRLKIVLLELKTLSSTFQNRDTELKSLQSIIIQKMENVHLKRKALVDILKNIDKACNSRVNLMFNDCEYKIMMFKIKNIKEKMKELRMDSNRNTIMKLKMQRLALQSLIK